MDKSNFITYINDAIKQEIILGSNKNQNKLTGLRNIKSDFDYIASKDPKLDAVNILKKLRKERSDNAAIYYSEQRTDLWLQEKTELELIDSYLPKLPSDSEVMSFLETLTDIPIQKKSFKKFQTACTEHFGVEVDSKTILDFIEKS